MAKRETSVKDLMQKISKERNIENPGIETQVSARKERYRPGEKILCHAEWVLMKRKSHGFFYGKV